MQARHDASSLSNFTITCFCRDDHGQTALHLAAAHGLAQEAAMLLQAAEGMRSAQQGQAVDGSSGALPRLDMLQVRLDKLADKKLHTVSSSSTSTTSVSQL